MHASQASAGDGTTSSRACICWVAAQARSLEAVQMTAGIRLYTSRFRLWRSVPWLPGTGTSSRHSDNVQCIHLSAASTLQLPYVQHSTNSHSTGNTSQQLPIKCHARIIRLCRRVWGTTSKRLWQHQLCVATGWLWNTTARLGELWDC